MIKVTRKNTEFTDRDTGEQRTVSDPSIYINPRYIKRIQSTVYDHTVIEIEDERYATWCVETPDEVYALIEKQGKQL